MGNDYIENDFMSPTTEEIMKARPLAIILPEDVVTHATRSCSRSEQHQCGRAVAANLPEQLVCTRK